VPAQDGSGDKRKGGRGPGGFSWKAILLVILGIYTLLLIIVNAQRVKVHFVFVTARTRVIFLVLVCIGLGFLIAWLMPRIRQRRRDDE
jgi:uncharacterized integral membrane protein